MFWKQLSLLSYNKKKQHLNQSKRLTAATALARVIVSRLLKWYECSGDGWKLQEERVELNCWQQESQYISPFSNRLLSFCEAFPLYRDELLTHTVWQCHCHIFCRKIVLRQGYEAGGTPTFGSQVVVESSQFCMFVNCHQKWIKWSHL